MLKKNYIKKGSNDINLITGRNTLTDYNNNRISSFKDKFNSININKNKIMHSLYESPFQQNKNSLNYDSNYPLGLSYQTQTNTQPQFYSSHKLNNTYSTDFSHKRIKNSKQILKKLKTTISKI